MVVHACNPSTQEAKVGGLWVCGQPRLHSKTLSQKKKKCRAKANTTFTLCWWDGKCTTSLRNSSSFLTWTYHRTGHSASGCLPKRTESMFLTTYIEMFITALKVIVKTWRQSQCPSTGKEKANCGTFRWWKTIQCKEEPTSPTAPWVSAGVGARTPADAQVLP
jgi:hypothetical protein